MSTPIVTITAAAATTKLTTLARIKQELGITDSGSDTILGEMIAQASAAIASHLGRTIARETIAETWRPVAARDNIIVTRAPIVSITSIVEAGATLTGADYEADKDAGIIYRLSSDARVQWPASKTVITYVCGWLLPDEAGRTLPEDIERACIETVKGRYLARTRDPSIKSESVPGVFSVTYSSDDASTSQHALPPMAAAMLQPYLRLGVWGL